MRHVRWLPAALLMPVITGCPFLTGCGKPWNESIDLVGTPPLPALTETPEQTELRPDPSLLAALDRTSWTMVSVGVPTHQVSNYPNYVSLFRWDKNRGPFDPAYPEAVGAVVDDSDAGADVADAAFQPVWAAALLLWAPIDMIIGNWPWVRHRSPEEAYVLVPPRTALRVESWFELPARQPDLVPWSPSESTAPDAPTGTQPR